MKLTIELSSAQAYILRDALDAYSRLLAGQVSIPVRDTAAYIFLHQRAFDSMEFYERSQKITAKLDELQQLITGLDSGVSFGIYAEEVPDQARQAYDLQQVIRYAIAWHLNPEGNSFAVDYDQPTQTSRVLPLAKVSASRTPEDKEGP